jgi:hypothetical protein
MKERVQHIIRHLTCPCGYTAADLLREGRYSEIDFLLPHLPPGTPDPTPAKRVWLIHTECGRRFQWDEVVATEK